MDAVRRGLRHDDGASLGVDPRVEPNFGHQSGRQAADVANIIRELRYDLGSSFGNVLAPRAAQPRKTKKDKNLISKMLKE